jgi:mono/diheme cytochrome c family protein
MIRTVKLIFVFAMACVPLISCFESDQERFEIATSKSYEASLFRQNCAICHGPEAEGKVLENGTKVPSLREGEFKFHTESEIYNQIANGGNGMAPFRLILSDREVHIMAKFVHDKLRSQN